MIGSEPFSLEKGEEQEYNLVVWRACNGGVDYADYAELIITREGNLYCSHGMKIFSSFFFLFPELI